MKSSLPNDERFLRHRHSAKYLTLDVKLRWKDHAKRKAQELNANYRILTYLWKKYSVSQGNIALRADPNTYPYLRGASLEMHGNQY